MAKKSKPTLKFRQNADFKKSARLYCKRPGKHGGNSPDGNRMMNKNGDYTKGAFGLFKKQNKN